VWLLSSALLAACGGDAKGREVQPQTGTLFVPLEASTSNGSRYRLGSAELALSGSEELTLDLSGDSNSLSTSLLIGPYSATLRPGWALFRLVICDPEPVVAELRSANPARFEIEQGETTSLTLRFRTNGRDIDLGDDEPVVAMPDAGGGPDDLGNPQFPGAGGSSMGGAGMGGSNTGGAGGNGSEPDGGSANGGSSTTPDPTDAGTPTTGVDSGAPDDGICSAPGALCIDDVLEQLTDAGTLPLCIPNEQTATTLGNVTVCGGRTCGNGSAGCEILANTSQSSASVRANGTVDISAVAQLTPTTVPVQLPPVILIGSVTCNVGVSGTVVTNASAVPVFGGDGLVSGFNLGPPQTDLSGVVLTVQTGGFPCSTLTPALNGLRNTLAPQVNAAVQESLRDLFAGIVDALACQRCDGACPLACVQR
jgi:hypothetical protein